LLRQTIAALREELEIGIRGQKSEDSGQRSESNRSTFNVQHPTFNEERWACSI